MNLWNESSTATRIIIVAAIAAIACGLAALCVLGLGLVGVLSLPGTGTEVAPVTPEAPVIVVTAPVPTPAPGKPYVTANATINIRSGPGTNYPKIGVMAIGLSGEVVGVSPDRAWWVIKYPPGPNGQGWVTAESVTPFNTENVPVIQPPAVPTPTAAPPVAITGWRGEYFDNRDLQGQPVLVRDDAKIDFDWGEGSPDPKVPVDNFSARWTISRDLPGGTYRFSIWVDDGVRLWIDDQLIIDDWREGGARNVSADLNLSRGTHSARVEYFESTGAALIQLEVGYIDQYPEWKAEYFDNPNVQEPPVVVRNEADINYNWGPNPPAPGVPADNFSARWSRRVFVQEEGNYLVRLDVEGGARLWLDGVLLIDDWSSKGLRALEAQTGNIKSGDHDLRIDYFKATGNGQIRATSSKIGADGPPKASISGATEAKVGQPVAFNARSSSVSPGSHIETFLWEFGDGTNASGVDVVHIYTAPGVYEVKLTVTDDKGQSNTATHQITITGEPVAPEGPKPVITAPEEADVGQPVVFDASKSQSSNTIVSYAWQFGDGTAANAIMVDKAYDRPGTYNVILTLTDNQGLQSSTNKPIRIVPEAVLPTLEPPEETPTPEPEATDTPEVEQQPPSAAFGVSLDGVTELPVAGPTPAEVEQMIYFIGTVSQPGSSEIVSYEWDFGDGEQATGDQATHAYSEPATYVVTLTVTDANGLSDMTTREVQVTGSLEPQETPATES